MSMSPTPHVRGKGEGEWRSKQVGYTQHVRTRDADTVLTEIIWDRKI